MPNAKLYIDQTVWNTGQAEFKAMLPSIREILCKRLNVPPAACQLALVPVYGLSDQPDVNIELHIMPQPERTRELLSGLGQELRETIGALSKTGCAVRIASLDPATYVALK